MFRYTTNYILYLIVVIFCFTGILNSQEKILRFEHLTVDDGLPQNTIQGIVKDKYGFIWLGTWEGLCRFDGYEFKVYKSSIDNPNTLYNNRINFLFKDKKGDVWICGADTMISRYNYLTDDFTRFTHDQLPQWLIDSMDRTKSISYTSAENAEYRWVVYQQNNILTRKLQVNEINNLLMQTNKKTGDKIIYRKDPVNYWSLSDEFVYHMYLDDQEIFWVGTYSGGINKADLKQKPFHYYYSKYNDPNSIIDNMIRAFCEDQDGNLWVGTHNKGITKINRKRDIYTHYSAAKYKTDYNISNNLIRRIYCDSYGYVWVGTKGGADRYNPKTGRFNHYTFPVHFRMPKDWIYDFMEDHNGDLWIGTWTGIGKYNRKNDRFYMYDVPSTIPKHSVRRIVEDKKYNLWVATEGGLAKLKRGPVDGFIEKLTPKFFLNNPQETNSLSNDRIYSMIIDDEGIIWLGTAKGLNRLDPETEKFSHFSYEQGLPDEFIVGILDDKKGNLWISHKKGIARFNKSTHKVRNFNKLDGLQSSDFSEDAYYRNPASGEMFFGGVNGFNSFFPDSIKDNHYLPVIRFTNLFIDNQPVSLNQKVNNYKILAKPLYMSDSLLLPYNLKNFSIEFAALHFSSPIKNKYKYKLENYDKEWIDSDANDRKAIYSNLSPGKYNLLVMASNCDGIWNPEPAVLHITILSPWWRKWWFVLIVSLIIFSVIVFINYTRAQNYLKKELLLSNEVNERTKELKHINEVLREKQFFIQSQSEELKSANDKLSVLNSTKDRLFSIIAHDLRNPFHTVSGFSELLLRNYMKLPPEKIEKYLKLINISSTSGNNLLENLLQWSRSQSGTLTFEPETLNLWALIDENISLIEAEAHRKNLTFQSYVNQEITVFADENMVKTIIRNLFSNAIKFTPEGGTVTIEASIQGAMVEIVIVDTGIGIPEDKVPLIFDVHTLISTKGTSNESGTGLGLIICKEFVERHNGVIRVESEINKGSRFIFTIPGRRN